MPVTSVCFLKTAVNFIQEELTQGPSGEFPINSAKHYIYRINQYVGIPGNVVQGRFTTNEEWEAACGYHNQRYCQNCYLAMIQIHGIQHVAGLLKMQMEII
ncbi:MAG: hypothetical protein MZV64_38175 [Ignavibacteriales bacterium]|nr:hypothetical protein [Ignavibacteriales bacterium]